MAVVNSENEAEVLRFLYFNYGPHNLERDGLNSETTSPEPNPTPEPAEANIHIGFHDRFIEGEYLSVRGK